MYITEPTASVFLDESVTTEHNGSAGSYDHFHNWFFVVQDPFGMFSKETAPYIMPELNIVIFFAVESVVILILTLIRRASCSRP